MWRFEPLSASRLASISILQNNIHLAARKPNQLATFWCSVATSFRWRNLQRHQGLTRLASFPHGCFSYFFDCLFVIYHLSGACWENRPPQFVTATQPERRGLMVALQESWRPSISFIKKQQCFLFILLWDFYCLFVCFYSSSYSLCLLLLLFSLQLPSNIKCWPHCASQNTLNITISKTV